jgi:hypothetical protein
MPLTVAASQDWRIQAFLDRGRVEVLRADLLKDGDTIVGVVERPEATSSAPIAGAVATKLAELIVVINAAAADEAAANAAREAAIRAAQEPAEE